jgi:hypothetical protein
MNDKVKELLDDFNVTLEFSVKDINSLLNILAQMPFIQVVGFINEIQNQAGPQVEKARKSLEAVAEANKNES